MKKLLLLLLLPCACLSLANAQRKVDRTPPAVFEQYFKERLVSLEAVLDGRNYFPSDTTGGVLLLSERLDYVEDDGTRYTVYHAIDYGKTQSGADANEELTYSFDNEHQRIYLISARSVQEDGTSQEVEDKATFIQSPQYEASNSLYTSESELKIIFPNVKAGTIIEAVVMIEDFQPIMREEVAGMRTLGAYWPVYSQRLSISLPRSYASRLRFDTLQAGVREPERISEEEGRIRFEWSAPPSSAWDWEASAPRGAFVLPSIWWSTMESWDTVAAWFNGLISERQELGDELEKFVVEWTAGLSSRQAIIDKLTEKVANEVRYTGLEFGLAGYQPYSCASVWSNQYGDCKDKANLLRALLKAKGIEAHMALLQTDGHGRINKDHPSNRQFDHVIIAIPEDDGSYQFIDPTIEYLPAGKIGFSDSARDVLIVTGEKATWARTPDGLLGTIDVFLDIDLEVSGALSGWISLKASGADASYYRSVYNDARPETRKTKLLELADQFLPGASLVDVDYKEVTGSSDEFEIRGYLVRNSGVGVPDTFSFPYPKTWLPSFQAKKDRKHPYRAIRRTERFLGTVRLPEGYSASNLPVPFAARSESSEFAAKWEAEANLLKANIEWLPRKAILSPDEFLVYRQSVNALKAWLARPANIAFTGSVADTASQNLTLQNFPLLSSGASQLQLVEEKYPESSDKRLRRLALDQVVQWFPNDPDTVFEATLNKYLIDWTTPNSGEMAEKVDALLKKFDGQLTIQNRAWAEYIYARSIWYDKNDASAIASLLGLANNTELNSYRRGWSAYYAALMLSESNHRKAAKIIEEHSQAYSEARSAMDGLYARLFLEKNEYRKFAQFFGRLTKERGDEVASSYDAIVSETIDAWGDISPKVRGQVVEHLNSFFEDNRRFDAARNEWLVFSENLKADQVRTAFSARLTSYLEKFKPAWYAVPPEKAEIVESAALIEKIIKANDESRPEELLDASMRLLANEQCRYSDFAKYLRWAIWWMDNRDMEPELISYLAQESLALPADDEFELYRCWLMLGDHYSARNQVDSARRYFNAVLERPDSERYQKVAAGAGLAKLAIGLEEYDVAAEAFAFVEADYSTHTDSSDYLLLDGFLHLQEKDYDKALRVFKLILNIEQQYLDESDYALVTRNLIPLLESEEALVAYWKNSENWWGEWETLCDRYDLPAGSVQNLFAMDEFLNLSSELAVAAKQKNTPLFLSKLRMNIILARWIPIFGVDFSNNLSNAGAIDSALLSELRRCAIALFDGAPAVDADIGTSFKLQLAVHLIDERRYQEATPVVRQLIEQAGQESPKGQAALRLWLSIAINTVKDHEEPTERMEALLAGGEPVYERSNAVRLLSDAYYVTKNYDASVALKDREEVGGLEASDQELLSLLRLRADILESDLSRFGALSESVNAWLDQRKFTWWEEIEPTSLDAGNPAYDKGPIDLPNAPIGQELKANILFALDEGKPLEERLDAFQEAVTNALYLAESPAVVRDIVRDALDRSALDRRRKVPIYFNGMTFLAHAFRTAEYRELMDTEFGSSLADFAVKSLTATANSIEHFNASVELLAGAADPLLGIPLDSDLDYQMGEIFQRLVYLGHPEIADSIFERTASMTTSHYADRNLASFRLGWMRVIKRAKANYPVYEFLRHWVRERLGVATRDKPTRFDEMLHPDFLEICSTEETRQILAYVFERGVFPGGSVNDFAMHLRKSLSAESKIGDLGLELLKVLQGESISELALDEWLPFAIGVVDVDVPEYDAKLESIVRSLIDSDRLGTDTAKAAESYLRWRVIRTSPEPQPNELFSDSAKAYYNEPVLTQIKLRYHYSRGQWQELGGLLTSSDYTQIEDLTSLAIAYKGLNLFNRADEASMVRDYIDSKIRELRAWAWTGGGADRLYELISTAIVLGEPDVVPAALVNSVLSRMSDNFKRSVLETEYAFLHRNWELVERHCRESLSLIPDYYDANGYLGFALANKGEAEAAKENLTLFLNYARDSIVYQEAKALRESL